ncbi:MAG TPA: hypothetical protein VII97_07585 [Anaerolineales bacterium]
MTLFTRALVTVSTFAHAFWNFLGKRQNLSAAFFLMAHLQFPIAFEQKQLPFTMIEQRIALRVELAALFVSERRDPDRVVLIVLIGRLIKAARSFLVVTGWIFMTFSPEA